MKISCTLSATNANAERPRTREKMQTARSRGKKFHRCVGNRWIAWVCERKMDPTVRPHERHARTTLSLDALSDHKFTLRRGRCPRRLRRRAGRPEKHGGAVLVLRWASSAALQEYCCEWPPACTPPPFHCLGKHLLYNIISFSSTFKIQEVLFSLQTCTFLKKRRFSEDVVFQKSTSRQHGSTRFRIRRLPEATHDKPTTYRSLRSPCSWLYTGAWPS